MLPKVKLCPILEDMCQTDVDIDADINVDIVDAVYYTIDYTY